MFIFCEGISCCLKWKQCFIPHGDAWAASGILKLSNDMSGKGEIKTWKTLNHWWYGWGTVWYSVNFAEQTGLMFKI